MFFASDNGATVAPEIMAAIMAANAAPSLSYGDDAATAALTATIRAVFEAPDAAVFLVSTGTAANALALAILAPSWSTIFCHRHAHIAEDECNAPEFFTGGAKLTLVDGAHGRIAPQALATAIAGAGGSVHGAQRGALSLSTVTEAGSVYSTADLAALATLARDHGLPVHLDGARLANALATTGASPANMTWRAGVDILSLGGTKNGLMAGEAVVIFDPARAWEFQLRRKRAGHLGSKLRYMAAQFEAWFADDLWLRLAGAANAKAARLAAGLTDQGATLLHPVEANMIFARLPASAHSRATGAGAVYYRMDAQLCRLVTGWDTPEADIDALLAAFLGPAARGV
ncbi:threonine aldolase family protein [Szabonella alba]|uniref:Low specificity L-threonine aldolase n=1 Tax=Szabonella alba TaxID=2804194 RepID=A0A8K0VET2_9RHOB|nr:beta-eliminating lyase-related protein [Szabonella alba]MBL4918928.1 low specificity L-threonine aldolase [Szabonella alba]